MVLRTGRKSGKAGRKTRAPGDRMVFRVPMRLQREFLSFLDMAQSCLLTEDRVADLTPKEKEVLALVEKWVGEGKSFRQEKKKPARNPIR